MPLKHVAMSVADEVASSAKAVGAANTLVPRRAGGWLAENTDVTGIRAALAERSVRPTSVTVLGAGATAQAVVVALAELGIARCAVLVRDATRADRLVGTAHGVGVDADVAPLRPDAPELAADLVVSTLPPGAADLIAERPWSSHQALLDGVYDPWPTRSAAAVQAAGGVLVSGALMLLHQASAQVELMTGRTAPVEAMRAALRTAAPGCGV
jgi:shikimate dehydrogenase